jgi:hypothetical protein
LVKAAGLLFVCLVGAGISAAESALGGTVLSAKSGEPLKSVRVSLSPADASGSPPAHTTSGAEGKFLFTRLPAGEYRLEFRKPGYQAASAPAGTIPLSTDEKVTDLEVRMVPAAAITGRVVDIEGEPVPDAQVFAYGRIYRGKWVMLTQAARAQADDLGEYRLYNLVAGEYIVSATPPRLGTPAGEFYAGSADVYYPQALDPSQSLPLNVEWGQELAWTAD